MAGFAIALYGDCRNAGDNGGRPNFALYYRVCCDYRSIPNFCGPQYGNIVANPNIPPNFHCPSTPELTLRRRFAWMRLVFTAIDAVIMIRYVNPAAHERMASDFDRFNARYVKVV
jgi:hypothetical protein